MKNQFNTIFKVRNTYMEMLIATLAVALTVVRKKLNIIFLLFLLLFVSCAEKTTQITLESLLDEMVSVEEAARYPAIPYQCRQVSSYDRSSITPDSCGWFANNDGFGIVRVDTVNGRLERVMFDEQGPGVITRIWITTIDKRGTWRFYFDGEEAPGWVISGYDLMKFGIPGLGKGLLQPHTSYTVDGKGGSTLFLPIPFSKSCKITFEDEAGIIATPKYYHINYRKYPKGTLIETFSKGVVARAGKKISKIDNLLLHPSVRTDVRRKEKQQILRPGDSLYFDLPQGENAVYEVSFHVNEVDSTLYAQLMRNLIFKASFDKTSTIWVPLSDYSGGGMGAPAVESWFLSADGHGKVISRWLMPYKREGRLLVQNVSTHSINISMEVATAPLQWGESSLYFHASWRQQNQLPVSDRPDDDQSCREWNFATLIGCGVYKGDVLTLYNHSRAWYGEGDEKIWVDRDTFPSHFGTGTEDYYNSSWAPVVVFQTPFGGAPRADQQSSHGYNTFFRTRNLDGIPFSSLLKFDIELLSWVRGTVDYATTVYWYGNIDAKAMGTSGLDEAQRELLPVPIDLAKYHRKNSLEFEDMTPSEASLSTRFDKQSMIAFDDGQWSGGTQLLCSGGKPGDYVDFKFDQLENIPYQIMIYATKAVDYGIITFSINGKDIPVKFDGYNTRVMLSEAISLGSFIPDNGAITLRVTLLGTNPKSIGEKYMFGLDCIQFIKSK
jgi:hypothetical protein